MPLEGQIPAEFGGLLTQRYLVQFMTYLPGSVSVLEQANHPLLLGASLT